MDSVMPKIYQYDLILFFNSVDYITNPNLNIICCL